ncbi:MAG: nucleoside triphosphate pyrophosphatase [Planctomycetota bacterium]
MSTSQLVLGSSSRYRAELLQRLGVPFVQEAPGVDEESFDPLFHELGPEAFALRLAMEKARDLRQMHGNRWLLCADQVGVVEVNGDQRLLRKPQTPERCVEQLMLLSGRTHRLVNGIVLMSEGDGTALTATDEQVLTMREFGRDEAERYVELREPMDSAGGYRIEDEGILLFESMKSLDYTGIIGLPLIATARLFREAGIILPRPAR